MRCRDAALLLLSGCAGELTFEDVTAAVSEDVVTVATVSFQTNRKVAAQVEYGVDGAFDLSTPLEREPGKAHTAALVGVPEQTEVSYRIVADGVVSEVGTVTTGVLPEGVPTATVSGEGGDGYLLTSVNGNVNWVLLLDAEGRVVWYNADRRGLSLFRAAVARDGQGVLFSSAIQGGGPAEASEIVRVPWAGGPVEEIPVPALAHDFVEAEDGAIVSLAYHEQDGFEGNSLLRIERDGTVTELWTTFDCYDPETQLGDDPSQGWTHANALDALDDGTFLVGLRNFGTIVRVDPAGRRCTWGFGGPHGTVALDGGRFVHQHQFEWTGSEMLVFDNDGLAGTESRALVYTFDGSGDVAPLVEQIRADPPEYSFIMGDVHRVGPDTLVAWAVPRTIDRYSPAGERVWRMEITGGGPLGFVSVLDTPFTEDRR